MIDFYWEDLPFFRCQRCRREWAHNAGPREHFFAVTRICPDCLPVVYPQVMR